MICKNSSCKKEFSSKYSHQVYCSESCRNIDNVRKWRHANSKTCPDCGKTIFNESEKCVKCSRLSRFLPDMTISQAEYELHHKSSAFALIRTRARAITKKLRRNSCEKCGYSKHTETCHITSIASFKKDTLISVVNAPDNLLVLCPNCHWEFDNSKSP